MVTLANEVSRMGPNTSSLFTPPSSPMTNHFPTAFNFLKGTLFGEHNSSTMVCFFLDNIRHFTDTLLLAKKEAERDGENMDALTDNHLIQTLSDIFFGELL